MKAKAMMVLAIAGIAAGLLLPAAPAQAKVLQEHHFVATRSVQVWKSIPVSGTIYVHVFASGREVPQEWVSDALNRYRFDGVRLGVRALGAKAPGKHPLRLHFWSIAGKVPFRVVIATTPRL